MSEDIRWKQRFSNYKKALKRLNENVRIFDEENMENFVLEAMIKCFELSYELAWNTMKDYISYKGFKKEIHGSRDSIRAAVNFHLIENEDTWMDMIEDRNRASHAYDEENAQILAKTIPSLYIDLLNKFEKKMDEIE
jgi:nucleotidyltransferase substrate binding protein (TIGR01987 family)